MLYLSLACFAARSTWTLGTNKDDRTSLFIFVDNNAHVLIIIMLLLEWTKLVCTPASTALFVCPRPGRTVYRLYRHIRQAAIPARVVLGTAVFCDQSNQYLVYEFPFCAMHMRVSSVSLPYLQNRLPSLIISAILAQYSSLCDHLVLQFNLG